MGKQTEISWTDSTFNWWEGCTKVGDGCKHCYAEARNARFAGGESINWGPGAPRRLTSEHNRNNLRRWNARQFVQCAGCGWRGEYKEFKQQEPGFVTTRCLACGHGGYVTARRRVFCSSLSDVFDNEAPQEWRDAMFAEMEACTNLDFLVLTKRIGNVRKMVPASWLEPGGWPSHVWLGATIVNQEEANRDIPKLLAVPARVSFLSMEPLLGPVDLTAIPISGSGHHEFDPVVTANVLNRAEQHPPLPHVNWVIVGGESGPGARPMHPDWARSLRNQCADEGVPFLFKQHGEHTYTVPASMDVEPSVYLNVDGRTATEAEALADGGTWKGMFKVGKKVAGNLLDGVKHEAWPT